MTLMENAMPPAEGTITTERQGSLLLVGINRPAKRNGFTPRMFRELGEAYTRLENSPDLFVGLLYAKGDHFSGGVDLPLMQVVARTSRHRLYASGGVTTLEDLRALADAGAYGAVIGMALYTGKLDATGVAREFA